MSAAEQTPVLEARAVTKHFGPIKALTDADVAVMPGEVHALAGENGAGKSTLLKTFAGLHEQTAGEMFIEGRPYRPGTVAGARDRGVGIVFQESTLQPRFTVAENLSLGQYGKHARGPLLSWKRMHDGARQILADTGIDVPVEAKAEDLTLGHQRLIELAAAICTKPRVLLVDEITASLDATEVRAFFKVVRRLTDAGTAVVYVSHHLEEIFELCDRVTVLRDGKVVGCKPVGELDETRLGSMMVGREIQNRDVAGQLKVRDEVALELDGVSSEDWFQDVSFSVAKGEIVGLAGLQGSGPEALLDAAFGLRSLDGGGMRLMGKDYSPRTARDAIRRGVGYVPKERDLDGAVGSFTARRNVTLPIADRLSTRGFLTAGAEARVTQPLIDAVGVKPARGDIPCDSLSGGNRQKVVIAKWLATQPQVLLLNNPTRGVDVGAKDEIYELLAGLAEEGMALLVASEELPELIGLCNRVIVMRRGRVAHEFGVGPERTEDALVEQML